MQLISTKKVISLIRDHRDIMCSLVDWLEKVETYSNTTIKFKENWYKLSRSKKICILIDISASKKQLSTFMEYDCNGMTLPQKIRETAQRAISFNKIPHVLVLRFEDIIGEKGRGSFYRQKQAFETVNKYLNLTIDNDQFLNILNSLWGRDDSDGIFQPTLFKGYIGRWKEEFDSEAIVYMKMYYNNILKKLGYEVNNDWDNDITL